MLTRAEKERYFYKDTRNFVEDVTNRTEQINERTKTVYDMFHHNLNADGTKVVFSQDQLRDIYDDCSAIASLSSIMYIYEHDYLHDYRKFMQDVGTSQEAPQAERVDHDIQEIHSKAEQMPNAHKRLKHPVAHHPASSAHSHQIGKEYFNNYTVERTESASSKIQKMFKRFSLGCRNFAKAFFD